jgi:hypothetical protein
MDYIYPVPFVLGWLLCLLHFFDTRRRLTLFAATSALGVGFYSYIASVLMMPLYFAVTVILLAVKREPVRHWVVAALGFLWPLLLIPLWIWAHPSLVSDTMSRYVPGQHVPVADALTTGLSLREVLAELRRPEHFSSLPGRLSLYWYFFDPSYLFVFGGYASAMNSTRRVGVFLLPFLALVPIGLWRLAASRSIPSGLVVFLFVTAPTAAVLAVPEPYAVDREMILIPAGVLAAVAGIMYLRTRPGIWPRRALAVLLLLIPLHFGFFLYDYYVDYRERSGFWFGFNHRDALESVIRADHDQPAPAIYLSPQRDPYVESYWQFAVLKAGRADLRAKTRLIDGSAVDVSQLPSGALLVLHANDRAVARILAHPEIIRVADVAEIGEAQQFWVVRRR